ncbi:polyprotein [Costus stripe mosaic virus]|uniref:Genome polyprotein n=1 Tax=Costus stripe mosaic virus TaxID=2591696 RepID=A0A4Y6JKU6_9POTV|nr:polyprotein [Costus stripe mosaic virus]QDF82349.1 polyprotein [Costus stripe mosaic virus]
MAIFVGTIPILCNNRAQFIFERARLASQVALQERQSNLDKCFAKLDEITAAKALSPSNIKYVNKYFKNQKPKKPTKSVKRCVVSKKIIPLEREHIVDKIVSNISVEDKAHTELISKLPLARSKKQKTAKRMQRAISVSDGTLESLTNFVMNCAKRAKGAVEVCCINKRCNILRVKKTRFGTRLFVETNHERGKIVPVDCYIDNLTLHLLKIAERKAMVEKAHKLTNPIPGDSGLVVQVQENDGTSLHILRGHQEGELVWADKYISMSDAKQMTHCSNNSIKDKFWDGLNKGFKRFAQESHIHKCERNCDVETVGELCGLALQRLTKMNLTTCKDCVKESLELSDDQLQEWINDSKWDEAIRAIDDNRARIVNRSLALINAQPRYVANVCVTAEAIRMSTNLNEDPEKHMKKIVEYIAKGNTCKQQDVDNAMKEAIEVIRWFQNRTENIRSGETSTFRNKVSAKSHLNLALMNDKMLNEDGLYDWKSKAYHCKRFYAEFFQQIEPGTDYSKLQVRKHIRGDRILAIKNLIISTNVERMQKAMEAYCIERLSITKSCITTSYGNYLYPCCCVTLDDKTPAFSQFFLPIKNHLVIGNTGDAKYVNVPTKDEKLMIVKDGYCYLYIFLSMMLHLPESDAKDFTKMVRDQIIPVLGTWPTMKTLAVMCIYICALYPMLSQAELPVILVDHKYKTMHIVDSYGSASVHYHMLKMNTVSQLMLFARSDLGGELKDYNVGGDPENFFDALSSLPATPAARPVASSSNLIPEQSETSLFKRLVRASFCKDKFENLLLTEPILLCMSLVSVKTLIRLHTNGHFEHAIMLLIERDENMASIAAILELLGKKVSCAQALTHQIEFMHTAAFQIEHKIMNIHRRGSSYKFVNEMIQIMVARKSTDESLNNNGWNSSCDYMLRKKEEFYANLEDQLWQELSLLEKCLYKLWCTQSSMHRIKHVSPTTLKITKETYAQSAGRHMDMMSSTVKSFALACRRKVSNMKHFVEAKFCNIFLYSIKKLVPDLVSLINMMVVLTILFEIFGFVNRVLVENQQYKLLKASEESITFEKRLNLAYNACEFELGKKPNHAEFLSYLESNDKEAFNWYTHTEVQQQYSNDTTTKKIEQIIAFSTLLLMLFDQERSDALFRTLMKCKGVFSGLGQMVQQQSLDDIKDELLDKKMTVDFELKHEQGDDPVYKEDTFEKFWDRQVTFGRVVPHYRTGGTFIEFTREKCVECVNNIHNNTTSREFLVRGAVGSGKSTGLPYYLSKKGSVLLVEPTRPLTENVTAQISSSPFHARPTMRMRNKSIFGSSAISIMTTGFAFQLLANNHQLISTYDYIIFDECHVVDEHGMALYSLLNSVEYGGKILKVSATPPGQESDFQTQHEVTVNIESNLSFDDFVKQQSTGSNACVVSRGCNILIYVASYNEVDALSNLLIGKGYKVTKVDGRTMKAGDTKIQTCGSKNQPHFIVATNIIENGVTLDIDVVVDFGKKIVPELDCDNRMIVYKKQPISYGERIQRMGRVGRITKGHVLRVGHTEKGLADIPQLSATGAALLCFAHNLPVMTGNVVVSSLANCTLSQVRTAINFEIPYLVTLELVDHYGRMHPEVHSVLKQYKLRDSEIRLAKEAIPFGVVTKWIEAYKYEMMTGRSLAMERHVKIPFLVNGVPDKVYEQLHNVVQMCKKDREPIRVTLSSVQQTAYTLRTDIKALPRTLGFIEELITEERRKAMTFQAMSESPINASSFSMCSIFERLKKRYLQDFSHENIAILERVKAQIIEHARLAPTNFDEQYLQDYCGLTLVNQQSREDVARALNLRGKYKSKEILQDVVVCVSTLAAGATMLYTYFKGSYSIRVTQEGKANRKLRFKNARFKEHLKSAFGDDSELAANFGDAYRKKEPKKGKTRGMGTKTRKFTTFYNFDPEDYEILRILDPITGVTYDHNPYEVCMDEVSEQLFTDRMSKLANDEIDVVSTNKSDGIKAYFISQRLGKALQVDLTRHEPLAISDRTHNIMGYPEMAGTYRQTGQPRVIEVKSVPEKNEYSPVEFEGKTMIRGPRDYNPIGEIICSLTVDHASGDSTVFGLGYGPYIITNAHLFKKMGSLRVVTQHGVFNVKSIDSIKIRQAAGRDLIVIRMPKDYPPLPRRLSFRQPGKAEKVVMLGAQYKTDRVITTVSGESAVYPSPGSHFWKHWISTKAGSCGLPVVSLKDLCVLGIHNLGGCGTQENFFTSFPDNFVETMLKEENEIWDSNWQYNHESVTWGTLYLPDFKPEFPFQPKKSLATLVQEVMCQAREDNDDHQTWLTQNLCHNLRVVGKLPGNLITKHVVKGKCPYFQMFLSEHEEMEKFFRPLMGHYGKSCLNKLAFVKDFTKYTSEIEVGNVDTQVFERSLVNVEEILRKAGIESTDYITDAQTIVDSLNMKAATGALYGQKKSDYFEGYTIKDFEEVVIASCERLYKGKFGIWNGSLKAELRPIEKVHANKTRVFTAAPLDTLLGGKVCVDDFNNQFYDAHLKGPWTVGISKFYKGWDSLLKALPNDWIYCDADGSQFDSSLTPYLINACLRLRLQFLENWSVGKRMIRNYYTEIIYTPIATPDGSIIKKHKGNNSGQPSTVVDNTLMVIMTMQYTLLKLGVTFGEQDSMIKYFANGDDLLIAVRPDCERLLDSMSSHFLDLGLKYDFSSRTRIKEELSYMSHRGIERDGTFIPKLDPERIVAILEWSRAETNEDRLNAIVASMIEAWGYDELLVNIRRFYMWLTSQYPFTELAARGKVPYISELALRKLYLDIDANSDELEQYLYERDEGDYPCTFTCVEFQSSDRAQTAIVTAPDKDVDAGTSGNFKVPRPKQRMLTMRLPNIKGKPVININHLATYKPRQEDISNTRATQEQFQEWYNKIKQDYEKSDSEMEILLNGFMVWCIENSTSMDLQGVWTMMDGDEQVSYPIAPMIQHAKPTLRQIMHHFSDAAQVYIEMRNMQERYMPRYGRIRNLRDFNLASVAFDFFEVTSTTSSTAKEAYYQMKAAALANTTTRMFGLDGGVGTSETNTERHVATDVNQTFHNIHGTRMA